MKEILCIVRKYCSSETRFILFLLIFWKYVFISPDERLYVIWNTRNRIWTWFINHIFCFHSFYESLGKGEDVPSELCFLNLVFEGPTCFSFLSFLPFQIDSSVISMLWCLRTNCEKIGKDLGYLLNDYMNKSLLYLSITYSVDSIWQH